MEKILDGIHGMLPQEKMAENVRKLRDAYAVTPGAPFVQREFGYYSLERWAAEGHPTDNASLKSLGFLTSSAAPFESR